MRMKIEERILPSKESMISTDQFIMILKKE